MGLIVTFFMCTTKFCSYLSATPITSILLLNLNLLLSNKKKNHPSAFMSQTHTQFSILHERKYGIKYIFYKADDSSEGSGACCQAC